MVSDVDLVTFDVWSFWDLWAVYSDQLWNRIYVIARRTDLDKLRNNTRDSCLRLWDVPEQFLKQIKMSTFWAFWALQTDPSKWQLGVGFQGFWLTWSKSETRSAKLDQNNAWAITGFNLKSHICTFNLGPMTIWHTNTLDPPDQHFDPTQDFYKSKN